MFSLYFVMQANPPDPRTFPFILLGNKIDIDGGNSRVVSEKKAKDWCASKGNIPYFETSAKEDFNVDAAFLCIAKAALANEHEQDIFGDAYDSLMFHFEDVKLPYLSGVHLLEPNVLGGSIFYCSYQQNFEECVCVLGGMKERKLCTVRPFPTLQDIFKGFLRRQFQKMNRGVDVHADMEILNNFLKSPCCCSSNSFWSFSAYVLYALIVRVNCVP
ncbi:hypothetical protein ACSQ67_014227 [Phaseolus vulgaris]